MRSIEGVEIFPVIGLLLFIGFFVWMVVRVWRSDKGWLNEMARMPMRKDEELEIENDGVES